MPLQAVFFDLDGTLLDTSLDLGHALNRLRAEESLPALEQAVIRAHVSNGASALVKLGFGEGLTESQFQDYRQRLLDQYAGDLASHTHPFLGIENLIASMAEVGIAWGIVTNKPQAYTEALMKYFSFAQPPAATVSPDQAGIGKPSPEPLLLACRQAGCAPENCIYVGDHERDIICGRNAGMPTIAVGYGFTAEPDDYLHWNATHTAKTANDIWPILQTYL